MSGAVGFVAGVQSCTEAGVRPYTWEKLIGFVSTQNVASCSDMVLKDVALLFKVTFEK